MKLDYFNSFCFGVILGLVLGILAYWQYNKTNSPVEEMKSLDSLIANRDSIKLKVEHLDSIKNAKVIEVSTLDNDSTVKLFYKLVSE